MTPSKLIELCDEFIERGNKFVGDVTFKDLYFLKEAPVLAKVCKIMYEALLAMPELELSNHTLAEVDKLMETDRKDEPSPKNMLQPFLDALADKPLRNTENI